MSQDRRAKIRDTRFLLDLVVEILHGCKWSCSGCAVNITGQDGFIAGDLEKLDALVKNFKSKGYTLGDVHVGPTDFMSARNADTILTDPEFIKFMQNFNIMVLGSTFLGKPEELEHWANLLSTYYSNMQINLVIIMDSAQVNNTKYLLKVRDNVRYFLERLKVDFTKQYINFNAFNYTTLKNTSNVTHQELSKKLIELFGIRPSYAFSLSRKGDKNVTENTEEVLQVVEWLNDVFYNIVVDKEFDPNKESFDKSFDPMAFQISLPTDWINKNYVYRNGKFYYAPIIYDPFVNFDPRLEIPVSEWVPEEFEQFEHNLLVSQYNNSSNKEECSTCPHLGICVQRGVLHLMDLLETSKCIVAKKAYDAVAERMKVIS